MISRLLAVIAAGLAFIAVPAAAKDKTPPAPTTPILPTVVNPDAKVQPENVVYLTLSNGGKVTLRLMPEWAPHHVERIKTLVSEHFYDGIIFHRVIDGFMAQTGDPTGTGQGGSKLPDLKAEFNMMPHVRGTLSMARTDQPDTANSQFFIVFYPRFALDRKYTVFGRVIGGMDVVDQIERGEPPANPTKIVSAVLGAPYVPNAALAAAPAEAATPAAEAPAAQPEPKLAKKSKKKRDPESEAPVAPPTDPTSFPGNNPSN